MSKVDQLMTRDRQIAEIGEFIVIVLCGPGSCERCPQWYIQSAGMPRERCHRERLHELDILPSPQPGSCAWSRSNRLPKFTHNNNLWYTEYDDRRTNRPWPSHHAPATSPKSFYSINPALNLSLCFNGHFPGAPGLAGTGMLPLWNLSELRMMEVVSGDNWSYKTCKTSVTTNKPTPSYFTGRMPFLSPNQQCQSTEGKRTLQNITANCT